jgi:hypothetical protein
MHGALESCVVIRGTNGLQLGDGYVDHLPLPTPQQKSLERVKIMRPLAKDLEANQSG